MAKSLLDEQWEKLDRIEELESKVIDLEMQSEKRCYSLCSLHCL